MRLKNICKTFNKGKINEQKVFDNFSLSIDEGDFISVIGSNGAGKSTLLNIISGKVEVDAGTIELKGEDVTDQKEYEKCKRISRDIPGSSPRHQSFHDHI